MLCVCVCVWKMIAHWMLTFARVIQALYIKQKSQWLDNRQQRVKNAESHVIPILGEFPIAHKCTQTYRIIKTKDDGINGVQLYSSILRIRRTMDACTHIIYSCSKNKTKKKPLVDLFEN